MKRPRIVWADEPTGNLDSKSAAQVLDLLRELHHDGTTLILVTHDIALAERADRRIESATVGSCPERSTEPMTAWVLVAVSIVCSLPFVYLAIARPELRSLCVPP